MIWAILYAIGFALTTPLAMKDARDAFEAFLVAASWPLAWPIACWLWLYDRINKQ